MNPEATPSVDTRLAVLEVKMDQLIALNQSRGEDHENRLRKLEERKFPLPTVSVVIAFTALVMSVITYLIGR